MVVRPRPLTTLLAGLILSLGLTVGLAAHAQLGSVNNPPSQHLFNFNDAPTPRNDGLGTMAERRRALARSKLRRPVQRTTP